MSERYKIGDRTVPHHVTLTIIDWVDLFTRAKYKDIMLATLQYCQKNKGLIIHAYCIMTSHIHLIVSSEATPLNELMRDIKKFTSKALIHAIKEGPESRKAWLLKKFHFAANRINRVRTFKVWQDGFHPVELDSNTMMEQRLDYVHNNPVEEGIVRRPEDYVYSSAGDYADEKGLIEVTLIE